MLTSRSRLSVIFFTVFIDLVGFGIVLPILPYYAQSFGARGLLFGALVGAYSGMQFLATAVLGRLSDRVGRRPILLTTMVVNAAGLSLLNFCSAYAILPESLKEEHRVTRELFDFGHLTAALTHPRVAPLMIAWGLIPLAFSGYTVALPLYAAVRFGWREKELGWFFTVVGITAAVVQGYLFAKLSRRVGDRALVIAGTFAMAVAGAVVPDLGPAAALYARAVLLAFGNSVVSPAATGLISVFADPTEQGAMLGAAQSLAALGRLTGPELVGITYDRFSPPWAFLAAGVVMTIAAGATLRLPGERAEAVSPS